MELKIILAIILITATANVTIGAGLGIPVHAEKKSAYDSGFDHGCSDAQISNPNDWYINGVNKHGESTGKDHHTAAFNAGYDAGFKECGYDDGGYYLQQTNTAVDDSFNNRDSVVQPQSQSANVNQVGQCPQMVINGDCYLGQEQNSDINMGQANRADN